MNDIIDEAAVTTEHSTTKVRVEEIPTSKLRTFAGHPYKVVDDKAMDALVDSIRKYGVIVTLLVRPLEDTTGEYEVISGHRRLHAARRAGLDTVPAVIEYVDRDTAAIELVDSNLHREHILPSEKAFAYKMKMEALKHQGRTSDQLGPKLTAEEIADGESASQVKRYIRLTELDTKLLDLVDRGKIGLLAGVELSHLTKNQQRDLHEAIEEMKNKRYPTLKQAEALRKNAVSGKLNSEVIQDILRGTKKDSSGRVSFKADTFRAFFPQGYSDQKIHETIIMLLKNHFGKEPTNSPQVDSAPSISANGEGAAREVTNK